MECCPLAVGDIISNVPERVPIEREITRFQMQLNATGHTPTIFEAQPFAFFCCLVLEVWSSYRSIGKPFDLAGDISPQMTAGDKPSTTVFIQRAVNLVEKI